MAGDFVENLSTPAWSARDLLEAARSACFDYERCERQLLALRARAESLGGGTSAGSVGGTSSHDSLERRVVALADRGRQLERQMDEDERAMVVAADMLLGRDGEGGGLVSLLDADTRWVAWAMWRYYVRGESWAEAARHAGYAPDYVRHRRDYALEVADACGLAATTEGRGIAEG